MEKTMTKEELNNLADKYIPTDYEELRQIARVQFVQAYKKEIIEGCVIAYAIKCISEYKEPKK
jgi:hypothetical protein